MTRCPLCLAEGLRPLPIALPAAMRSDGLILDEPLAKLSCDGCGALIGANSQPSDPYRRSDGQAPGDIARHARVAEGVAAQIARLGLRGPVLEVGAASFQTARHLAAALPGWRIVAVEPQPETPPEVPGVEVHVAPFESLSFDAPFGVIYSNHVLEHVPDTRAFLGRIADALAPDGVALLSCPCGLVPSHELLFSDHLYHFTPRAVAVAAQDAGLGLDESLPTPWEPLSRLFVLRRQSRPIPPPPPDLTAARRACLAAWEGAEARLLTQLGAEPVLFGAGEFSQLIRAYLPGVHARIAAITLDDPRGARAFDKPVVPLAGMDLRGRTVLAGVHPASVPALRRRLLERGAAAVLAVTLP